MNFLYVLLYGSEWEDIVILLSKEDAINESINHPSARVGVLRKLQTPPEIMCKLPISSEIFSKNNKLGYTPTYNYYKNGEFF